MKIAFATHDLVHVDAELRAATCLAVYEVGLQGARLAATHAFGAAPPGGSATEERLRALTGCALVVVAAIGPSAAARVAARGVRPATAPRGTRIEDVLARVRVLAAAAPARWLERALAVEARVESRELTTSP